MFSGKAQKFVPFREYNCASFKRIWVSICPLYHVSNFLAICIQKENFSLLSQTIFLAFCNLNSFHWIYENWSSLRVWFNSVIDELVREMPLQSTQFVITSNKPDKLEYFKVFHSSNHFEVFSTVWEHVLRLKLLVFWKHMHHLNILKSDIPKFMWHPS